MKDWGKSWIALEKCQHPHQQMIFRKLEIKYYPLLRSCVNMTWEIFHKTMRRSIKSVFCHSTTLLLWLQRLWSHFFLNVSKCHTQLNLLKERGCPNTDQNGGGTASRSVLSVWMSISTRQIPFAKYFLSPMVDCPTWSNTQQGTNVTTSEQHREWAQSGITQFMRPQTSPEKGVDYC